MDTLSFVNQTDPAVIEHYYEIYRRSPDELSVDWRLFFDGFSLKTDHYPLLPGQINGTIAGEGIISADVEKLKKEVGVTNLIDEYRRRGHLFTQVNPVRKRREYTPLITIDRFGLTEKDMDEPFAAGRLVGLGIAKLRDIIGKLERSYCRHIGCEFKFIRKPEMIEWLQTRMESTENTPNFSPEAKKAIFAKLNEAVLFEKFMHTRFTGQKRFSSEGLEAFIPAIETIVDYGAHIGVEEYVLGMAHRGRLSVLANIMQKPYELIFSEFDGKGYAEETGFGGDVKYHMGYSQDRMTASNRKVHLSMAANPSHLEAVNPVVEGMVRAKLDSRYNRDMKKIIPILIHGDASISGQGIVYEVIQYSELPGYDTGGTIHVVLNNQIGFTTDYTEGRSTTYCTDIAKVSKCPVFHVNGDDVESVVFAIKMALDFRQEFHRDVFIDILGYRRHGHNEGDDPRFSQPDLYKIIATHPDPLKIYSDKLIKENIIDGAYVKNAETAFFDRLDRELEKARQKETTSLNSYLQGDWKGFKVAKSEDIFHHYDTGVDKDKLAFIAQKITKLPADKPFFDKIEKIYAERHSSFFDKKTTDWALAEQLAFATLAEEGFCVRLSGQDCKRGTFSHRHSVLHVENSATGEQYMPLNNISANQGLVQIYNSVLSEYGVLGFEYGYSMSRPNCLTIWEAQFGDFANGAQIIIDQFITSCESKWQRMNGLVMLLPHGYEGQGPEHSSARPERFLQMCAEYNIQVMNITKPSNFFHALRRQIHRNFRKPLVIFTPKSLLRHPECVSSIDEYYSGKGFQEILDENNPAPNVVKRLLLCTGKIYFDLRKEIETRGVKDTAVVRIEQLYPFHKDALKAVYEKYNKAADKQWVQEEPENMGAAYYFLTKNLKMGVTLTIKARKASAAISTGFIRIHQKEHKILMDQVFGKA